MSILEVFRSRHFRRKYYSTTYMIHLFRMSMYFDLTRKDIHVQRCLLIFTGKGYFCVWFIETFQKFLWFAHTYSPDKFPIAHCNLNSHSIPQTNRQTCSWVQTSTHWINDMNLLELPSILSVIRRRFLLYDFIQLTLICGWVSEFI